MLIAKRETVNEQHACLALEFVGEPADELVIRLHQDCRRELRLFWIHDDLLVVRGHKGIELVWAIERLGLPKDLADHQVRRIGQGDEAAAHSVESGLDFTSEREIPIEMNVPSVVAVAPMPSR